jgi:DNA-binding response OmpR family regulator
VKGKSMTHILVVDDEPNNHRILNYTLNKAGYQTVTASNGEAALALFNQSEFKIDLAILDVAMPVMDGLTLLKNIREQACYKDLPVLMLTGSGDDDERIHAEQIGIQGYLTKPVGSKTILETVKKLIKDHAKA